MVGTAHPPTGRRRIASLVTAFALVASVFAIAPASALAAIGAFGSYGSGLGISLDTTSNGGTGAWTSLSGSAGFSADPSDFVVGNTISIAAPSGFEFNTAAGALDNTCAGIGGTITPGASAFTITMTGTTNSNSCHVALSSMQIRPTNRTPTSGNISAMFNVTSPVGVGPVSSVAGAAVKLTYAVPPPASITVNTGFPVTVQISDQFGNRVTNGMDTITLSMTSGTGTFGCTESPSIFTLNGLAPFTNCQFNTVGLKVLTATSFVGSTSAVSAGTTVVGGSGNHLTFDQQPGGGNVNVAWATQPIVAVRDVSNNLVTSFSGSVTLSITPGTGPVGAVLSCSGGNTMAVTSGRAIFAGCSINMAGTYSLDATTGLLGGPTPATSTLFVVGGAGVPHHLVFTQSPISGVGPALSPNPIVQVVDAAGTPVPSVYLVTLSLIAISGSGNLTCTNNPDWTSALTGRVTFTGCAVTGAGTFFLTATATGLVSGSSTSFTIGAGSTFVVFTTQPLGANIGGTTPTGTAGVPWTIQPVVAVRNASGQTITSDYSSQVTLSITPNTPTTGGPGVLTCTGGLTRQVTAGVATFTGCSINIAGTGYQLRATVSSSTTVPVGSRTDSLGFNIAAAPQVAFTTQPLGAYSGYVPNGPAGTAFAVQPVVAIRNAAGQTITNDYTSRVTLSITPNTPLTGGPGVLSCTGGNTVTVSAGVATFAGCSINAQGTYYQLRATVTSSTTVATGIFVDSLPFSLTQATAQISLVTYPSVVTWGDPFTATIQFTGGGNHAFTLQRLAATDGGVWRNIATGTTDSTGRAVLQYSPRFNGQYKVVFAGDASLGAGTSNLRTVNVRNLVILRPSWSGVKTVGAGFAQTYQATVRPVPSGGLPGGVSRVEFQFWRLTGGTWVKVKGIVVSLSSSGVGSLRYTWSSSGQWYIRAVTLPNVYNYVGHSDVERINVQ